MRKVLLGIGVLIIVFIGGTQIFLPHWADAYAEHFLQAKGAEEAQVRLSSTPAFLLLLGEANSVEVTARNIAVGPVTLSEAHITGQNVRFDAGTAWSQHEFQLESATSLTMEGRMNAEAIRNLLQKKVGDLDNLSVEVLPDRIRATATAKAFGQTLHILLEGMVVEDGKSLYFHVSNLDVQGASFANSLLEGLVGDVPLVSLSRFPVPMKVDHVSIENGEVVVTLVRENS